MMREDDLISVEELHRRLDETQRELRDRMDDYNERASIADEAVQARDGNLSTTDRAIAALKRPERFHGEHDVARAWLRNYDPHIRIFTRAVR